MAIRKRWEVSDDLKAACIERAARIVACNPKDEIALKAIDVISKMEQQNQKDERGTPKRDGNRFLEVAQRLGLVAPVVDVPEVGPVGDPDAADATDEQEDGA